MKTRTKRELSDVYAPPPKGMMVIVRLDDNGRVVQEMDKWGNCTGDYILYDQDGIVRVRDGCQNFVMIVGNRRAQTEPTFVGQLMDEAAMRASR